MITGHYAAVTVMCYCSALYISSFLMMFVYVLATGVGLVIYAYYQQAGCDPLRSRRINSPNQVIHVDLSKI